MPRGKKKTRARHQPSLEKRARGRSPVASRRARGRRRTFVPDVLQQLLRRRRARAVLHDEEHLRGRWRGRDRERGRVERGGSGTRKHRPRSIWGAGCGRDDDPGERNRPGRTRTALASIPARTLSPAGNPGRSAWMRSWQLLLGCIADSIATAEPGGAVARSVRPARARDERIISPTPVSSRAPGFRRAERRRWVRERRPRTMLLRRADSRGEVRARSPSARECVCVGGRRAANDGREGSISFFSPLPRGFQPENVRVRRLESAVFSRRRKCHPSVIRADRGENILGQWGEFRGRDPSISKRAMTGSRRASCAESPPVQKVNV